MPQANRSSRLLYRATDVRIRPSAEFEFEIAWGEGSAREYMLTRSPSLAGVLATMPPCSEEAIACDRLTSALGISAADALALVERLTAYGFWITEPRPLNPGEQHWDTVGWYDALLFHMATRNTVWSHDYSGSPAVMTRFSGTGNVQPDTLRPDRIAREYRQTVPLPEPAALKTDYWQAHDNRRTHRDFRGTRIELADLATVLALTFRPSSSEGQPPAYTTQTYSLGSPFHAYVITGGAGVPSELERQFGVYHYDPAAHALGLVRTAAEIDRLDALLWRQSYVNSAPVMLVICVDWLQFMWKYRMPRAYRFAITECGAFMQTALLVATALGLQTFQTPAMDDVAMGRALEIVDHEMAPLYMATLGR